MILFKLVLSTFVGLAIGLIHKDKNASRVFTLICVGATLATIISVEFFRLIDMPWHSDPARIAAQIISALGFICAGFIWISDNKKVKGLSQSAGLWYTAIIGMLIGASLSSLTWAVLIFVFLFYITTMNIAKILKNLIK
ncbi:MAG: MgtC/SapB family protein [Syntrophomonadaceae bacterium]|nr:MgtC/SapB family protein [Syntrophomonadaceae bacterium]